MPADEATSKKHVKRQAGPVALDRRDFLIGATALGSGALAMASQTIQAPTATTTPADPRTLTYRETEHVRAFYKRARF